ncbi:hypothetical protein BSLG_004082 [Batrachochytrium salamandrivorans]|nr:hypothetical protein BASA81_016681 [Batrachochytrium salamandrivorans]KAH9266895.1 hypothetical protein BASA83_010248 [Batrachochytrium salamandrivorans]KAJ1341352.1 hypothetical protein BSLG_004082 [Batrachochytrium salamandrivorans]
MRKALLQAVVLAIAWVAQVAMSSPVISNSPDRHLSKIPVWSPSASFESKSSPRPQPFADRPSYPPSRIPVLDPSLNRHNMKIKGRNPAPSTSLDDSIVKTLSRYMKFSGAVYCANISTSRMWDCGELCTGETSGTQVLATLHDTKSNRHGSAVGIIAIQHNTETIIVAFRGSVFLSDWVTNFKFSIAVTAGTLFKSKDRSAPRNVLIHSGYRRAYLRIRKQLRFSLKAIVSLFPAYQIVFTGHSMGGGLASIAAMDAAVDFGPPKTPSMHIYTYGMPRVGNSVWANWVNSISFGSVYRVARWNDPIPRIPQMFLGYRHFSQGIGIDRNDRTVNCTNTGVAGETSDCDGVKSGSPSVEAHIWGYYWAS